MTQFQYLDGGNTEAQDKLAEAYLFEQASEGIAKTGVISGLGVSQTTTATAAVKVGAGAAIVQSSRLAGADRLINDTDVASLDVLTANPVGGLPRYDIVVFDSAALPNGIRVIVGTPNAAPTDPTVPSSAIPLARLRHAASATAVPASAIDDLRVFTGLAAAQGVPFADFSRGAGGNIARVTWTKLAYTTQNERAGGITYSGGDFTVPKAGLYECLVQNMFTGSAGLSVVGALIAVDGTTKGFTYSSATSAGNWAAFVKRTLRLAAGQKVSFSAYHDATAAIPTQADVNATFAQVRWVGA